MTDLPNEVPEESEQLDQIQPDDSLDYRGVDDILDEGYSPPERPSELLRHGEHQTLDERLAAEEPDFGTMDAGDEIVDDGEVGAERAGRLVDPNGGIGPDLEKDLVAQDVGIDGAAASAEEAAVHVIRDDGSCCPGTACCLLTRSKSLGVSARLH
jgi:hypothetical protein